MEEFRQGCHEVVNYSFKISARSWNCWKEVLAIIGGFDLLFGVCVFLTCGLTVSAVWRKRCVLLFKCLPDSVPFTLVFWWM